MSWRFHGRAKVSTRDPSAFGVCQRCGLWYNLDDLVWQFDWRGNVLQNLWLRVCKVTCLDVPQQQYRSPVLPPDPVPRWMPRPETFTSDDNQQGFNFYSLVNTPAGQTLTQAQVLDTVATLSGIATPAFYVDDSGLTGSANVASELYAPNAARSWMLLYNPGARPFSVSFGTAKMGASSSILVGPGGVLLWASSLGGNLATFQGEMTIVSPVGAQPYWAWEAES